MITLRRFIAAVFAATLMSAMAAAPASAQIFQGPGLVNVAIEDVTVQVPLSVAANLCDINAAVLVGQFIDDGDATCTATAESMATRGPSGGGGGGIAQGPGLVNVAISDLTVQVPISVAANICDVNAAILVGQFADGGDATCTATAESLASRGPSGGGGGGGGGGG
jgi:hypothetical protein